MASSLPSPVTLNLPTNLADQPLTGLAYINENALVVSAGRHTGGTTFIVHPASGVASHTINIVANGLFSGVATSANYILLSGDAGAGQTQTQVFTYPDLKQVWKNTYQPHFQARNCTFIKSSTGEPTNSFALVGGTVGLDANAQYTFTAECSVFNPASSGGWGAPSFTQSTPQFPYQVYCVGVDGYGDLLAVGTRLSWRAINQPEGNVPAEPAQGLSFLPNWLINLKTQKVFEIQGIGKGGQTVGVVVAPILGDKDPDVLFVQGGEPGLKGQSYIVPSADVNAIMGGAKPIPSNFIPIGEALDGRNARVVDLTGNGLLDIVLVCASQGVRLYEQTSKGQFTEHILANPDFNNCAARGLAISSTNQVAVTWMPGSGPATCGLGLYNFST